MKNPTREFARRVYRLHRRPLLKASLIALGPLCLLDCAKVFFTSSGLLPTGRSLCSTRPPCACCIR